MHFSAYEPYNKGILFFELNGNLLDEALLRGYWQWNFEDNACLLLAAVLSGFSFSTTSFCPLGLPDSAASSGVQAL